MAIWDGTSGSVLKDGGLPSAGSAGVGIYSSGSAFTDGHLLVWNGNSGSLVRDGGEVPTGGGGGDILQDVNFSETAGLFVPDNAGNFCPVLSNIGTNTITGDGVTTDGSASFIDAGDAIVGRFTWTVAVRFKTTSGASSGEGWQRPALYAVALTGAGNDFGLTINNGYFCGWDGFTPDTAYENFVSSLIVNDGAWHTAVATCDGAKVDWYCDGTKYHTHNFGTNRVTPFSAHNAGPGYSRNPWMGRLNTWDFGNDNFGSVDITFGRLRCYRKALSEAEVASLTW